MSEDAAADVVADLQKIYGRWTRETTVQQMRADWDEAFAPRAKNWPIDRFAIGDMNAEWIAAPHADATRAILYLHGGGFRIGSIASHRDLIQRLSEAAQARVLAIDYRLSPECLFPAPVDDALAAWRWLLEQGHAPASPSQATAPAAASRFPSCSPRARKTCPCPAPPV